MNYKSKLELALESVKSAGNLIMEIYKHSVKVEFKEDGSPLTIADQQSNDLIVTKLDQSGVPVISEEGNHRSQGADQYWIVDPLDGTKDFLAANDEFVINIGLVNGNYPVLGVVFAPALDELYYTAPDLGVWFEQNDKRYELTKKPKSKNLSMAVSRFHDSIESKHFAKKNGINEWKPVGSALKLGRIARADIDVYPRLVGTSEWDTAAGQAILESSGGFVIDIDSGKRLRYGKEKRLNGSFLAARSPYSFNDFVF